MPTQSYLSVLGRNWKLLAAITLLPTVVAAALVVFVLRPVYEGRTTVIFPLKKASSFMRRSLSDLDLPVSSMPSILEATQTLYNHIAIIESRTLALRVYEYLKAEKGIDLLATYPDILRDPDLDTEELRLRALAKRMQKRVNVEDTDRGVAEVSFLHTDPEVAAAVANAYVTQTLAYLNELNRSTQSDLATFLEARKQEVERTLADVESRIQQAKEETGILAVEEQAAQLIKSYADIQAIVAQAEIDYEGSRTQARNMAEAGMEMQDYYEWLAASQSPQGTAPAPAVDALADATIAKLRSDLDELELKRQQALLYSTPDNPEVITLNAQIQTLREQLYREFADYYDAAVASLVVESTAYQAQLNVGRRILQDLDRRLESYPPDERRIIELERDRDVQESIYLVVSQELEQARIAQRRNETPFTVLDEALVPTKPVRPRKLLVTFGTMAIAFWLGVLVVFSVDAGRSPVEVRG